MAYAGCGGRSVALGRTTENPHNWVFFSRLLLPPLQIDLQRVYDGLFTALFPLSMIQDAEILVSWKGSHWTGYEKCIRRPIKDPNSEY
jgi:hypothetical protein